MTTKGTKGPQVRPAEDGLQPLPADACRYDHELLCLTETLGVFWFIQFAIYQKMFFWGCFLALDKQPFFLCGFWDLPKEVFGPFLLKDFLGMIFMLLTLLKQLDVKQLFFVTRFPAFAQLLFGPSPGILQRKNPSDSTHCNSHHLLIAKVCKVPVISCPSTLMLRHLKKWGAVSWFLLLVNIGSD